MIVCSPDLKGRQVAVGLGWIRVQEFKAQSLGFGVQGFRVVSLDCWVQGLVDGVRFRSSTSMLANLSARRSRHVVHRQLHVASCLGHHYSVLER